MSAPKRSPLFLILACVVALSGWAVAVGLGLRLREHPQPTPHIQSPPPPPPATPPPSTPAPTESEIEKAYREFSSQAVFAGAALAFCLLDENGETLFASPLAETALCPASSLKTVTTGAALGILGLDFTFGTTLVTTAPLDATGAVDGDLVLVGGGDPTFATEDLFQLVNDALAGGLKKVSGRLRVDASILPANPVNDHWVWGDLGNGYGVGAFGLNLDHNRLGISFEPGPQPGAPARVLEHSAVARDTRWENHVRTGPAGSGDQVVVYSEPYGRLITLRGTVPAGESGFTVSGAIPDPPALALELLRARFESAGVKFGNKPGPFPTTTRTTLASHRSASLPEIIDHLHRVSDNLEAQCLFLTLGLKQSVDPATAVRQHWEKAGVAFVGLRLLDGSGLARANMIRALDLARVNFAAGRSPYGERFRESLSTYLDGHVRAKIGSMSGVKTQVGFLRTAQGREFTFAVMANGLGPGRDFWSLHETLLEAVRQNY